MGNTAYDSEDYKKQNIKLRKTAIKIYERVQEKMSTPSQHLCAMLRMLCISQCI